MTKSFRCYVALLTLTTCTTAGAAAEPAPGALAALTPIRTLAEALSRAYSNDPQLLAARSTARAADNLLPEARAQYGPTLDIEATHGYQRDHIDLAPSTAYSAKGLSTTAQAVLTQPLMTFGRIRSAENGARAQIANARDTMRLTEAQAFQNVIEAYVSVRRDAALVRISEENLALLQKEYDDNTERFRFHAITLTDLQQVETRLEQGRAGLIRAHGQLGASRAAFVSSVGAAPGDLAEPAALPISFATIEDAQSYAEDHSPLVRAAQSREKISRANMNAARAEFGPRLDLRGTVASDPTEPYYNTLRDNEVRGEVVFSMRLFDSGLRAAQVRDAKDTNDADWRLIDQAMRETRASVATSWEQLASIRQSLDHYRAAVSAAQNAYDGAVLQERSGARTTLDVLNLARDLLDARTSYVSAVADEYLAQASLLSAVGDLEAQQLIRDVPAYDPDRHLRRVRSAGDVPLLTPIVRSLDSITAGGAVQVDRPSRDAASAVRVAPQNGPMPAPPGPLPLSTAD